MMVNSDPVTSIPVHRSTLRVLQRIKDAAETWDELLLELAVDFISPARRSELDQRLTREAIVPGADVRRQFKERRRRVGSSR